MKATEISIFQKKLLNWFKKNKRDLPFRKTKDPYKIWLSEIMAQQTTLTAVIPYYERFIKSYPTMASVAQAKEKDLLKLWEGLGYYARIRNFQSACQCVVNKLQGKIPDTFAELKKLKGVGAYTAAAIASICFNEKVAVVDGNVKRILSRLYHYKKEINTTEAKKFFDDKTRVLLVHKKPGEFNEAMMELGALVCQKKPACAACPVAVFCLSKSKEPQKLPYKKATVYQDVVYATLLMCCGSKILFKSPSQDSLISNMWELPTVYGDQAKAPEKSWCDQFFQKDRKQQVSYIGKVKHAITNKRIQTDVYLVKTSPRRLTKQGLSGFTVLSKEELKFVPVNTLSRKILNKYYFI